MKRSRGDLGVEGGWWVKSESDRENLFEVGEVERESAERWLRLEIGVRREVPVRSLSRKNRVEQKLRLAFLGASVVAGR